MRAERLLALGQEIKRCCLVSPAFIEAIVLRREHPEAEEKCENRNSHGFALFGTGILRIALRRPCPTGKDIRFLQANAREYRLTGSSYASAHE